MKRITALVMILAMILTLAACGGKNADQPSSNTPPVTQDEPNQPNSTPDNIQPSEPTDTTPNEPQNDSWAFPEPGYYLYDGVHYILLSESIPCSTLISGEKSVNTIHEMSVAQAESVTGRVCGSMSFPLGLNEGPFDYQISFADESKAEFLGLGRTVASGETATFNIADAFVRVVNPSNEEKTVADCPILCFRVDGIEDENRNELLDGQSIVTLDALINILGTPTAAYSVDFPATYYIWQFDDYIYTAWLQNMEVEDRFDEETQIPYFVVDWDNAPVHGLSYFALNYNLDEINLYETFDQWYSTWPVQALTDLGLL